MLSKNNIDIPYISKEPLSAKTEWVAIPVYVSVKSKEFHSAAKKSKEVIISSFDKVKEAKLDEFPTSLLDFESEFEELKSVIELIKINESESKAKIYNYIIIKYPENGSFWEKIEHLSNVLDELYKYSSQYKSDKNINIQFGERYDFGK